MGSQQQTGTRTLSPDGSLSARLLAGAPLWGLCLREPRPSERGQAGAQVARHPFSRRGLALVEKLGARPPGAYLWPFAWMLGQSGPSSDTRGGISLQGPQAWLMGCRGSFLGPPGSSRDVALSPSCAVQRCSCFRRSCLEELGGSTSAFCCPRPECY